MLASTLLQPSEWTGNEGAREVYVGGEQSVDKVRHSHSLLSIFAGSKVCLYVETVWSGKETRSCA